MCGLKSRVDSLVSVHRRSGKCSGNINHCVNVQEVKKKVADLKEETAKGLLGAAALKCVLGEITTGYFKPLTYNSGLKLNILLRIVPFLSRRWLITTEIMNEMRMRCCWMLSKKHLTWLINQVFFLNCY